MAEEKKNDLVACLKEAEASQKLMETNLDRVKAKKGQLN